MQVGGIYFINLKTKDYFPEGAGLLNLSVFYMNKRAMIRNYFGVMHILIEKTQPAQYDPGTSPEEPLNALT